MLSFVTIFFPFHKEESHVKILNIPACKIQRIVKQILHTWPFMCHHLNKESFLRNFILSCPFSQCVSIFHSI